MIWLCVKRTSNVHKDRTLESRNSKNPYDFFIQVRNFLLSLSLKVFRHKEREREREREREKHKLSILAFSSAPTPRVAPATKVSASKKKPTVFCRGRSHLNSLTFSKSPKILRVLPVRDVIRTLLPPFPVWAIVTSLSNTSALPVRAREHLR